MSLRAFLSFLFWRERVRFAPRAPGSLCDLPDADNQAKPCLKACFQARERRLLPRWLGIAEYGRKAPRTCSGLAPLGSIVQISPAPPEKSTHLSTRQCVLFSTKSADGGINPACVGRNRFAMKSDFVGIGEADLISSEAVG